MTQTKKQTYLSLLALITLLLLLLPATVQAQDIVTIDLLQVVVWPEFDTSDALIFYRGTADSGSGPATLTFNLPPAAEINAIAYNDPASGLVSLEMSQDGDNITFTTPNGSFWIEFYDSISFDGDNRTYELAFASDHAINILAYEIQTPYLASGMDVSLTDTSSAIDSFGLPITIAEYADIAPDEMQALTISYVKSDPTFSVVGINVNPVNEAPDTSSDTSPNISNTASTPGGSNTMVIIGLSIVGAALLGGGFFWWWTSRDTEDYVPPRDRKQARPKQTGGKQRFCTQCGKAIDNRDTFCRHCGSRV